MADPAAAGDIAPDHALLDWGRLRTASRTGIAAAVATVLITIFQFPFGAWALVTILVMTQPNVGASASKGVMRVVGTVVGGLLGLVLLHLVQDPIPFLGFFFAILFTATYLGSGTVLPYAFVMGGLTAVIVGTIGLVTVETAAADAFVRIGEVALGVAVAVFVSLAVWPTRARVELPRRLEIGVRRCRFLLRVIAEQILGGATRHPDVPQVQRSLHAAFRENGQLLAQAAYESRFFAERRSLLLRQILQIDELHSVLTELDHAASARVEHALAAIFEEPLSAVFSSLDTALADLERAVGSMQDCEDPGPSARRAFDLLRRRYDEIRAGHGTQPYPTAEIARFDSIVLELHELAGIVERAARTATEIHTPPTSPALPPPTRSSLLPSWLARLVAIRPVLDDRRGRFAIKCAVATTLTLVLWTLVQWSGGVEAVISAYIVTQSSVGGSNRKLLLRLAGAVAGGILAFLVIVFLVPNVQTLPPLLVVIFAVTTACAWVMLGSEFISYGGLQAGITFALTLFPEALQPATIDPAVSRFIAVLFAAIVTGLVLRTLWPVHAGRDLRASLAGILREIRNLLDLLPFHGDAPSGRVADVRERVRELLTRVSGLTPLVGEATLEARDFGIDKHEGISLIAASEGLLRSIDAVAIDLEGSLGPAALDSIADAATSHVAALRSVLGGLADGLEANTPTSARPDTADTLDLVDRQLAAFRAAGKMISLETPQRARLTALVSNLHELTDRVARIAWIRAAHRTDRAA